MLAEFKTFSSSLFWSDEWAGCLRYCSCCTKKCHNLGKYEFNPEVPKLEKSVSGSSPSRDRLLLTVATVLMSAILLS
ncbi:hypothetical protein ATANTOWER_010364 [Ataeniobius toweri]|uniref:Uncharacterized protein n=1 Tax=Ataeniobius toweri TaxID=208326 RepID=A0ABU7BF82_9TELE|nr:hypothetical protein [Ataeniobius toweri]